VPDGSRHSFGFAGSDQFLHVGPRRSHGVSQGPRASSTGVIRSGSLERGQPILDGGDPARPDSPTARDLVRGARLPQLGDEHAGEPGHLFLGSREVGQPCPAPTCRVFGTLTVEEVIAFGDTALAEAAHPVLGEAGFAMMAAAALLATSSSVNANIYGAVGSTAQLAEAGQFPPAFGRAGLVGSTRGLTISVVAVLLLANLVDLSAIASLGSVVALAIFLLVAVVGLRLRAETRSRTWVIVIAIAATAAVLVTFAVQMFRTEPETFVAMIVVLVLAIILEYTWSLIRARRAAGNVSTGDPPAPSGGR